MEKPTPAKSDTHSLPGDYPRYLSIPDLNINNTEVMPLGEQANGQIATPNNNRDTGWYKSSSKPGQAGAMFIYGHVGIGNDEGIFRRLEQLQPGAIISITRGNNTVVKYRMITSKTYPHLEVDMEQVLAPVVAGIAGLNLMTCAGEIIKGTTDYTERLVVFATLVQ